MRLMISGRFLYKILNPQWLHLIPGRALSSFLLTSFPQLFRAQTYFIQNINMLSLKNFILNRGNQILYILAMVLLKLLKIRN